MRTYRMLMPYACLTIAALLTGCTSNTKTAQGTVPSDPAVHRSDVETLVKNAPPAKPTAAPKPQATTMPTEKELGLPYYPGAKPFHDETGVVTAASSEGMKIALLETPDSIEQVTAFYRAEMPQATVTKAKSGSDYTVRLSEVAGENGLKAVEIAFKEKKTQITLTAVDEMPGLEPQTPATATGAEPSGVGN
jgi:hypothetical protein